MKVHILGGGIGGMSCALHLARLSRDGVLAQDLEVHVYEKSDRLGGKAASQFEERGAPGARWPGEHGFRFFPNFYRCIVDTLAYVRLSDGHVTQRGLRPELAGRSVQDLLTPAPEAGIGFGRVHTIARSQSIVDLPRVIGEVLSTFGIGAHDIETFTSEMLRFLFTSNERALTTYENETLASFLDEHDFSPEMRTFVKSLRALSAMRANRGSLRTLLFTATQMLADFDPEYHLFDALLPGTTDDLMLDPWAETLRDFGVNMHFGHRVTELRFVERPFGLPSRLETAKLEHEGADFTIEASDDQIVVLAVPYEIAYPLLRDAPNLPSTLRGVLAVPQQPDNLGAGAEPMVGIQFWLAKDVSLVKGHTVYPTVPWAMTSISQAQFWRSTYTKPLADAFEAPGLDGILSTIVSAWEEESPGLGKAPKDCTEEELAREAFEQLASQTAGELSWEDVIAFHVDRNIAFSNGVAFCSTPLWVSPKGSYLSRPLPDPGCGNFFIASDWARTETDVGSMESADESARWVVRAIARRQPVPPPDARLPKIRPLRLWAVVEAGRAVDRWLYERGLPHALDLPPAVRRMILRSLRALRGGAKLVELIDDWSILRFGAPRGTSDDASWLRAAIEGAAKDELDRVVRFLEAIESSTSGTAQRTLGSLVVRLNTID